MWDLIAFIVLVAIIFGVSLHDAFIGIIVFILGFILFIILLILARLGFAIGHYKLRQLLYSPQHVETEEEKAQRKILKAEQRKKNIKSEIAGGLVALWLFSPWILVILLSTTFKEFSDKNSWVYIFALLPYLLPIGFVIFKLLESLIIGIYVRIKRLFKKRTSHKG